MARITTQTTITGRSIGSVRKRNTRQVVVPSIAAASNGSFGRLCRPASSSSVNHGVHSQMSVRQDDAEGAPALHQPGLALEADGFQHHIDDAELVVEDPADHDRGDDRRHHQRHQQDRLHQLLSAKRTVEQQRQRQPRHQRAGDAEHHEQEGVRQHHVEERRIRDHGDDSGRSRSRSFWDYRAPSRESWRWRRSRSAPPETAASTAQPARSEAARSAVARRTWDAAMPTSPFSPPGRQAVTTLVAGTCVKPVFSGSMGGASKASQCGLCKSTIGLCEARTGERQTLMQTST